MLPGLTKIFLGWLLACFQPVVDAICQNTLGLKSPSGSVLNTWGIKEIISEIRFIFLRFVFEATLEAFRIREECFSLQREYKLSSKFSIMLLGINDADWGGFFFRTAKTTQICSAYKM